MNAPAARAYALWLDVERLPEFMEEIEWVRRIDETRLLWRINLGGQLRECETQLTVQIPSKRISWRSHSGFSNSGTVLFEECDSGQTRITFGIFIDPAEIGADEQHAAELIGPRLERDLQRFKALVESAP